MDNNMNVVDYNNLENNVGQSVQPQPVQMPNVEPQPMGQPSPMPEMGQVPVNPEPQPVPVQPINQQSIDQNVNMVYQSFETPTIDVNQTPTEIFGAPVNEQPVSTPDVQNIIPPTGPAEAEQPKYGYMTNEDKPNLNTDSNANIKFIIFLAILMLGFIIALPYLSNMLG